MAPAAHHGKPHSGAKLDQCYERDLRRTAETHRWTIDANPARRIDRHSRGKIETLYKSPAARGRRNRARNGQPDLTAVAVAGELQEGPMVDHLLGPVRLVPERERTSIRRYTRERTLRCQGNPTGHRRYRRSRARPYHRPRVLMHCGAPGCRVSPAPLSCARRRWRNRDCPEPPVSRTAVAPATVPSTAAASVMCRGDSET